MAASRRQAIDDHEKVDAFLRKKPCRSCLDFKAWRAQMQASTDTMTSDVSSANFTLYWPVSDRL